MTSALHRAVFHRDHGICASCGLDTVALRRAYWMALEAEHGRHIESLIDLPLAAQRSQEAWRHQGELRSIRARLRDLGYTAADADRIEWWDLDHATALDEGGGHTLGNASTRCLPCHRQRTREHTARRARRPNKAWRPHRVNRRGQPVG